MNRWGPGISPGYYECGRQILSKEKYRRKIEPKEIPSCLIPCVLIVFTWELEMLLTTLQWIVSSSFGITVLGPGDKALFCC